MPAACGLRDGVASHLAMLSVGYGTNDPNQPLSLAQARNYWYHWYMATPRGERVVREEREAFARQMWDTWAPAGWYDPADFDEAARAFQGEDWAEIVLHSYRHRWGFAEGDPAYAEDEARLNPAPVLSVPTLVLHGSEDEYGSAAHPRLIAGHVGGPVQMQLLTDTHHVPHRERPPQVLELVAGFLAGIR